eukprot:TRINITY_DN6744_c0_g3_i3.p1 TRINITY_DN6744_c0_g3~~TRINITY_DN6744_c0_g3_i3.p1  ORF type:complete len:259 (-),score=72.36 TRINITY_DN6744_c0_g3_i3:210-986(-)
MTCDITEADADATFPLTGDVACTEPTTVVVRAGARVEFRAAVPVHLSQYRFVVEDGAELVFSGVHFTFENSDAPADEACGGAIASSGGTVTFACPVTFTNNSAEMGGAVFCNDDCKMVFEGAAVFDSNTATEGGAVAADTGGEITFTSTALFDVNAAENGGAVHTGNDGGLVTFQSATYFNGNEATAGNCVYVDGDGNVVFEANPTYFNGEDQPADGDIVNTAVCVSCLFETQAIPAHRGLVVDLRRGTPAGTILPLA